MSQNVTQRQSAGTRNTLLRTRALEEARAYERPTNHLFRSEGKRAQASRRKRLALAMTAVVATKEHERINGVCEQGYTVAQVSDIVKRQTGVVPSLLELERQVELLVLSGLLDGMKGKRVRTYPMLLRDEMLTTYHMQ